MELHGHLHFHDQCQMALVDLSPCICECMFHIKNIHRRNFSTPIYDPINEHDIPAHYLHIHNPTIPTSPPHTVTRKSTYSPQRTLSARDRCTKAMLSPSFLQSTASMKMNSSKSSKGLYAVVHQALFTRGTSAPILLLPA